MTAPVTIVITLRAVAEQRLPQPHKLKRLRKAGLPVEPVGRIRQEWKAEFVGGPHHGESAGGESHDQAIGALIRQTANRYETADELLDWFASLFDSSDRVGAVKLARAVKLAANNRFRQHAGVAIQAPDTKIDAKEKHRTPLARPLQSASAERGGVA